jgi:phage virion morphogenesis protein
MSGLAFRIAIEEIGAKTALDALRLSGEHLGPLLEDIGAELESSTLERFDTNIAPDGTPWKPSLRAQATGGRTLVETSTLRDSVHYRVDGESAVEIGAGGAAGAYAAVHQFGATITAKGKALKFRLASGEFVQVRSVKIPARPYLGLSAADREAIPAIVVDHWQRAVAQGGP